MDDQKAFADVEKLIKQVEKETDKSSKRGFQGPYIATTEDLLTLAKAVVALRPKP